MNVENLMNGMRCKNCDFPADYCKNCYDAMAQKLESAHSEVKKLQDSYALLAVTMSDALRVRDLQLSDFRKALDFILTDAEGPDSMYNTAEAVIAKYPVIGKRPAEPSKDNPWTPNKTL